MIQHDVQNHLLTLFPFARVHTETILDNPEGRFVFKATGHPSCDLEMLARLMGMLCGRWEDGFTNKIPVCHCAQLSRNTERTLFDILYAHPKNRVLIIDMVDRSNDFIASLTGSLGDFLVFLRYIKPSSYPAPNIRMRPLAYKELKKHITWIHDLWRGGDLDKKMWRPDKTLINAIFEQTFGYQKSVSEITSKIQNKKSTGKAMEMIEDTTSKEAGRLYGVIADRSSSLDDVVAALEKAVSVGSWFELGGYVLDRLTSDLLAGTGKSVTDGEHLLLTLDLDSSKPKFVAGCLEIAKVLRQHT